MSAIIYPFYPPNKTFEFVNIDNPFMQAAMQIAKTEAYLSGYEPKTPVGVVFVKNDRILISAANGSSHHALHGCERKKLGIPPGERYDLCPGCDYANHAEPKAVRLAQQQRIDLFGSDLYLFGEWWICPPCWQALSPLQPNHIFLLSYSEIYFNRSHPDSKCGNFTFFEHQLNS